MLLFLERDCIKSRIIRSQHNFCTNNPFHRQTSATRSLSPSLFAALTNWPNADRLYYISLRDPSYYLPVVVLLFVRFTLKLNREKGTCSLSPNTQKKCILKSRPPQSALQYWRLVADIFVVKRATCT
jgi:hypothetical protein